MSDFDADEEYTPQWYVYEGGQTRGKSGPESGIIVADEEWGDPDDDEDADGRLTLEQSRGDAGGFIVSSTLYGWMYHATTASTEDDARRIYEAMRHDLESLSEMLPYEEDGPRRIEEKTATLLGAIAAFEAKYPT